MIRVENYLKNGNVLAGVDGPAVHGVGTGEVDHLAQHHPVVCFGVHVPPVARQGQLVRHVGVASECVVDPVREGDLLLVQDYHLAKYDGLGETVGMTDDRFGWD